MSGTILKPILQQNNYNFFNFSKMKKKSHRSKHSRLLWVCGGSSGVVSENQPISVLHAWEGGVSEPVATYVVWQEEGGGAGGSVCWTTAACSCCWRNWSMKEKTIYGN